MSSTSSKNLLFFILIIFFTYLCSFPNATCSRTANVFGEQSLAFVNSVQSTIQSFHQAISVLTSQLNRNSETNNFTLSSAIQDCIQLLDHSVELLGSSINASIGSQCDCRSSPCTSISAALANHETCTEGLDFVTNNSSVKKRVTQEVSPLKEMIVHLLTLVESEPALPNDNSAPWIKNHIGMVAEGSFEVNVNVDVTVALDGSGDYYRIMDAVNAAPNNSKRRFVIHIKRGVYDEHVDIPNYKTNLVMVGDGQGVTIITGKRSVKSGSSTFDSATVAVGGCGFMASYLTIQNTAGPDGGQAVAMRSNAENLVFYKVTFNGYQDTLYARSGKQFFRECEIKGTVDFIFGDATAVFQLCKIMVRKTMNANTNTITAQGREADCSHSGYSFHMCTFMAAEGLDKGTVTYLGRPWQKYSRTVIMKSSMGDLIHKDGWMDWDGRLHLSTIYYGEHSNNGPGSDVSGRVKSPGIHSNMNVEEAMNFCVGRFIDGDQWLPSTGVSYVSGLGDI